MDFQRSRVLSFIKHKHIFRLQAVIGALREDGLEQSLVSSLEYVAEVVGVMAGNAGYALCMAAHITTAF